MACWSPPAILGLCRTEGDPLTWGQVHRGAQDETAEGKQCPGQPHGCLEGSAGCVPPGRC